MINVGHTIDPDLLISVLSSDLRPDRQLAR